MFFRFDRKNSELHDVVTFFDFKPMSGDFFGHADTDFAYLEHNYFLIHHKMVRDPGSQKSISVSG